MGIFSFIIQLGGCKFIKSKWCTHNTDELAYEWSAYEHNNEPKKNQKKEIIIATHEWQIRAQSLKCAQFKLT